MAASALLGLLSPSSPPGARPSPSPTPLHVRATRRRHPRAVVRCLSLHLPLLPFQPAEVLIPSECKTLHLYEARYLALLEEALYRKNNSFVHFVLDPVVSGSPKASFAVRHGCLVQIESVERLDIGALVSIRGVCRVNTINLLQMEPYLRGDVSPIRDISSESIELGLRMSKLRESMCNLHSLQMKLKVPEDEPLQTNIKASLLWSEKENFEYNEGFIPELPERLSFAAYQTVSGMSEAELLSLQKYKVQAMDSTNTLERLNSGIEYVEHNIGMIAARLAIQNI
uniref:Lon N-terminal domain-containing protein n=1 Tax=Oryza punctata TaxID=4537 RepID=A0A0E0MDX3_ORYPU